MNVQISYADFIIIALMIILGFEGYRTGFFHGLLGVGGLFISMIITLLTLPYSSRFFNYVIELSPNLSILMGFLSIFVISLLLYALFLQWLHSIMKMQVVDWFDKVFGTLFGLYKGLLTISLLAIGFSLLPIPQVVQATENNSLFLKPVKYFAPTNYNYFRKLFPTAPSFEYTLRYAYAQMGQPDEVANVLIKDFANRRLEKNVPTTKKP